ncbi:hypothetical protein [Actinoplanes sp. ATCC 53533]|uniref:hypothetical protein n=1 Tax=Actinoplanes sp. ATCC 53533 TaxID=1288362 RepID=UPI000F7AE9AA|nr:hypothetical protein [Actinoplanes sp. ATCC 53533]
MTSIAQLAAETASQEATPADWTEAIATVVAAIGTVGALIYAAIGLARERQTRQYEIKRIEEDRREEQDMQARTVVLHHPTLPSAIENGLHYFTSYSVHFGNYGIHPITNVTGVLTHRETKLEVVFGNGGPTPLAVLNAGDVKQLKWNLAAHSIQHPVEIEAHNLANLFKLEMQFTDVHGIRWSVRPGLGQQPSRVYA